MNKRQMQARLNRQQRWLDGMKQRYQIDQDSWLETHARLQEERGQVVIERDRYRAELDKLQAAYDRLSERVIRAEADREAQHHMTVRCMAMIEKMGDRLASSPEVLSESLLTGLAAILAPQFQSPSESPPEESSMEAQGLNDMAGVDRGVWYPETEFDIAMEDTTRWPTPGHISQPESSTGETMAPPEMG